MTLSPPRSASAAASIARPSATLRPAVVLFIALTALTGALYPLVTTLTAQAAFPSQAEGSLIERDGQVIGSSLIGQAFTSPRYFWGRPSATSPMAYNAVASSGSNLGSTNPVLQQAARGRIAALQEADPDNAARIPADLIAASGSGLDPHISPAAARYQAARIARTRKIPVDEVIALIEANTARPTPAILGEPTVNVLGLNLALDGMRAEIRQPTR